MMYILILIVSALLLLYRSFLGFDQTDESYYYALAKRLCMGDRPFVDEWYPSQFFAVLLKPFYKIYTFFVPDGTGIILAGRITYLLFAILVAILIFRNIHKNKKVAIISALLYLFYARQNVMGLSYYQLYPSFMIIALILIKKAVAISDRICIKAGDDADGSMNSKVAIPLSFYAYMIFAGIFVSLAVICMPFLAPFIFIIWLLVLVRNRKALWFALGVVIAAIIYLWQVFQNSSIVELMANLPYVIENPDYADLSTMTKIIKTSLTLGLNCLTGALVMIVLLCMRIRKRPVGRKGFIISSLIAFILMLILGEGLINPGTVYIQISFIGAAYIVRKVIDSKDLKNDAIESKDDNTSVIAKKKFDIRFIIRDWSLIFYIAGVVMAFAFWIGSDTCATCLCTGLVVSSLGTVSMVYKYADGNKEFIKIIIALCLVMIMSVCYVRVFGPIYRDTANRSDLNTIIEQGPAKGLMAEAEDALMYNEVYTVLRNLEHEYPDSELKIFYSKFLPWAYLCTEYKFAAQTPWRIALVNEQLEIYETMHPEKMPDIVVIFNEDIGITNGMDGGEHMNEWNPHEGYLWDYMTEQGYTKITTTVAEIYIRRGL